MALIALMVLLLSSLAGLIVGRWRLAFACLPAAIVAGMLAAPEAVALAALAGVGVAVGVHLHAVVADDANRARPLA
jgi:hypothetical protein